jgi:hypothetical protein
MGQIRIVDRHGDTQVDWDVKDEASVEEARTLFQHKRLEGYFAYAVAPTDARKGTMLTEFDKTAERIVMTPPLVGG